MEITLNNRHKNIDSESITIDELLTLEKLSFKMRLVKINGRLIKHEKYGEEKVADGDNVQVLYLMSGG